MPPKKAAAAEDTTKAEADTGPKRLPVWVYGINDHLEGPKTLPADFKRCLTLREDYLKLCGIVGAVPHPGLKAKPKVPKPQPQGRRGSKGQTGELMLPGRRMSATRKDHAAAAAAATAAAAGGGSDPLNKEQWGGRRDSKPGLDLKPAEEKKEEKKPETEDPVLSVRSMLLDRISVHLLGLILPIATHIKVLVFSDCRLDVEMLRLLKDGLTGSTSVESLQIEWNTLEVPLPSEEELKAEEEAKKADAAAAAAAAAAAGDSARDGAGPAVPDVPDADPTTDRFDLEDRERRRYAVQSQRTLRIFKERLADLFEGGLEKAFEVLEAPGDAGTSLNYCDWQGVMEARLDISGPQIVQVFEVLDGPDYAGSEGCISINLLRKSLEGLPDEVVREGVDDPVGAALAPFFMADTVLECLSLRACGISRLEMATLATALKQGPWAMRILNLWDNYLCDRAAEMLGKAVEEYRGLEYIGLGRNRITDAGLAAICNPFNWQVLDGAGLTTAQNHVKAQQDKVDAAEKAKAKAKPKAAPAKDAPAPGDGGREKREPPLYVDDLKENPAEEDGGDSIWIFKRHTELKTLNLSENPIRDGRALEVLQMLGPEAELVLRGCPVSGQMLKKPDIPAKGRRASGVAGLPPHITLDGGWILRMGIV